MKRFVSNSSKGSQRDPVARFPWVGRSVASNVERKETLEAEVSGNEGGEEGKRGIEKRERTVDTCSQGFETSARLEIARGRGGRERAAGHGGWLT